MVFFSFLFSNIFSINDDYGIVTEEKVEEEIIDSKYDINLYQYGKKYLLVGDSFSLDIEANQEDFDYVLLNNELYVLLYEEEYYLCKYSLTGENISKQKIIDMLNINNTLNNALIRVIDNNIFILGTISNGDIFIISINSLDKIIYKSEKEENLIDAILYKENSSIKIYMYIEKEEVSEYPFGNGSCKIIAKADEKFNLEEIIYLDNEPFEKMFISSDYLFLVTKTKIQRYNTALANNGSFEKNDESSVFSGENGLLIVFGENSNYLLSQDTLEKVGEISSLEATNIKKLEKAFYSYENGKATYFDIIDLTKLIILEEGLTDYEDTTSVYSCFGKCESMGRTFDTYFDKAVFGTYEGSEEYKTASGITFIVNFCYNIKVQTNVVEGGVYKEGYHLLYNGKGLLDGQTIYNNEPCYGEGLHTLTVEGYNETYSVSFYVSEKQISFETYLGTKGKEFKVNENYYIELKFYNNEEYINYEIDKINILYDEYKSYTYEMGYLRIYFKPETKATDKEIFLKSVVFKYNDTKYTCIIGQLFHISIVNDSLLVNCNYEPAQNEVKYSVQDSDKLTRMFTIKLYDGTKEYIKSYGIYSQEIIIDELDNRAYNMEFYITYNIGTNIYKERKILDGVVKPQKNKIGYIKINKYQESLQEFTITINESSLYNLSYEGQTVYERSNTNIEKIIICSISSLVISFGIAKLIKEVLRRKRKSI